MNAGRKTLNRKRKLFTGMVIVGLLLILFVPFNLAIAPERKFRIVDTDGRPKKIVCVEQDWEQYALDISGYTGVLTVTNGQVWLPAREVRTNIASLISGALIQISYGHHASFFSFFSSEHIKIWALCHKEKSFSKYFLFHSGNFDEFESGVVVLEWGKTSYQKHWGWLREQRLESVNIGDGISLDEAVILSEEYIQRHFTACTWADIGKEVDGGAFWVIEVKSGDPVKLLDEKIKVDKKTGTISMKGKPTIPDPLEKWKDSP